LTAPPYDRRIGPSALSLTTSDLEAVLNAASETDRLSQECDVVDLLGSLGGLIGSDAVCWNRTAVRPRSLIAEVGHPREPVTARATYAEWADHIDEHRIMSGRHGPVVGVTDGYTRREFRRTWMYAHAFQGRIEHEVGVHLSHPPGQLHVVWLSRSKGSDFSERDRLVLQLLRPHLDAALRRLAFPLPSLTPREVEVLGCVREGCTNAQVARRLSITEATVEKHLEHVYARTGAQSRVQALALCGPLLG
jgi:DNA-binding CsgD family transcriptional regulator